MNILFAIVESRYESSALDLLVWIPIMILGYFMFLKSQKDLREGKVPGAKQSKHFFDWLFYGWFDR